MHPLPQRSLDPAVLTRRSLLKKGLAGIFAYAVAPSFVPSTVFGRNAPSNRITVGLIGLGLQCNGHARAVAARPDCQILALCDVDTRKFASYQELIGKEYANRGDGSAKGISCHQHSEELLARGDIDAVWVCTPDHWHAALSIAAMKAGKDVYCEKPLSLTVREGRLMADAARQYHRILQTGSQQRSNRAFRKACEMVRNGWIGDIKYARTKLGEFPQPEPLAEEPVPAGLDYDRWLGPTPWRPYNLQRILGNYGGGWRKYLEYGARKNGDWGAHHFDIIQWALGMDHSGPVDFIPQGYEGTPYQTHIYANGVRVERVDNGLKAMIEFGGTKGKIFVGRNEVLFTEPSALAAQPLRPEETRLYASDNHHEDFLNAIRHRQLPLCDVEIGHRTSTICHLNSIASILNRPLRWDPSKEELVGDPLASRLLDRPRRAPYDIL
jgi:predicted dehydrogenase